VGFGDAVRTCFTKYAEFKGRASRAEYWWFFLSYVIVYAVGLIIASAIRPFWYLLWLVLLAFFIPLLAAAVRRLHDTGRSGWWYFIALVPLVGTIILIVFLASEGQPGPNEYGPPPGGAIAGSPPGAIPPPPPA
jgi:uncharacterized membrane protein YhaH (DUF805 family)